jgi:hypothetical protein
MADNKEEKSSGDNDIQFAGYRGSLELLGGTEGFLDNQNHIGVAIHVTSAGGTASSLVISEVKKISETAPGFITKPVRLKLKNLTDFLKNQGVTMPDAVEDLLESTSVSCDAFYYTGKEGPLLMMFGLSFDAGKQHDGLIEKLSGSKDLGDLFEVTGVSLRVFRCDEAHFKRLKDYCAALSG